MISPAYTHSTFICSKELRCIFMLSLFLTLNDLSHCWFPDKCLLPQAVRMLLFVLLALGHATQGLPNVDDVTIPPWVTTTTEASRSLGPVDLDVQLPRSIKPLHYVVKLQPFINGNFSIVGYMEVEMEVLEPTSTSLSTYRISSLKTTP
nr:uncharacterized protein LOC113815294 [Penaeus vannamei]